MGLTLIAPIILTHTARGGITADRLNAIESGGRACSDFQYAAPSAQLTLLGTFVVQTGPTVRWDPETMQVPGHVAANAMIRNEVRPGRKIEDPI